MTTSTSKVREFILQAIVPILCSILVGFLFDQGQVFERRFTSFQFVWSAVVGSVFYYLLIHLRRRDAFLGFTLLVFLTFLSTESTRPAFILREIFYVGAIGLTIFVYYEYFRHNQVHNYAYPPFMLAGIYAVAYMTTSELHLAILRSLAADSIGASVVGLASTTAFFGVSIGFAIGAGIAINEKLSDVRKSRQNIAAA